MFKSLLSPFWVEKSESDAQNSSVSITNVLTFFVIYSTLKKYVIFCNDVLYLFFCMDFSIT